MSGEEAKKEQVKKQKKATALKRVEQNKKQNLRNKMVKSRVATSVRVLKQALKDNEDMTALQSKLNDAYSMVDKGAKIGIYKRNKAARFKSKLSKLCSN